MYHVVILRRSCFAAGLPASRPPGHPATRGDDSTGKTDDNRLPGVQRQDHGIPRPLIAGLTLLPDVPEGAGAGHVQPWGGVVSTRLNPIWST